MTDNSNKQIDIVSNPTEVPDKKVSYDPVSVLTCLALVRFDATGTKISLYKNKVYIQPYSITQRLSRTIYGDQKYDLQEIYPQLDFIINTYIKKKPDAYVKVIINSALEGIRILQSTYKHPQYKHLILMLQWYYDLLFDAVNDTKVVRDYSYLKELYGVEEFDLKVNNELWDKQSIKYFAEKLSDLMEAKENNKNEHKYYTELNNVITNKQDKYVEWLYNSK